MNLFDYFLVPPSEEPPSREILPTLGVALVTTVVVLVVTLRDQQVTALIWGALILSTTGKFVSFLEGPFDLECIF